MTGKRKTQVANSQEARREMRNAIKVDSNAGRANVKNAGRDANVRKRRSGVEAGRRTYCTNDE